MFSSCVYTVVPQLTTPDSIPVLSVQLLHLPFNLFKDPSKNKSSNVSPFSQNVRKFEIIFETACGFVINLNQVVSGNDKESKTNTLHIERTNVILTKAMLSSLSCRGA